MIGAIAGDIIGSVYEWHNIKTTEFPLFKSGSHFTDDTVMTVAVADSILHNKDLASTLKEYYKYYPHAGYGGKFKAWAQSDSLEPYKSWGNGSAMRVSPVGFAYSSLDDVISKAKESAEVTHNHPEGIKGAQATASAIFLARTGSSKQEIKMFIEDRYGYNLDEPLDKIRKYYKFDVSCQGSVPQAIIAFLESNDFEGAVRNAISIGGDSDTVACITGGIAQAFYKGVPEGIVRHVRKALDPRLNEILDAFNSRFAVLM